MQYINCTHGLFNNPLFLLDGLTHQEAIALIKSGGTHLTLMLKRGNGTVPDLVKELATSPHTR